MNAFSLVLNTIDANLSFHQTSFIVSPHSRLINLVTKTKFRKSRQVNSCWIQHFQHSYIFGPLKCWKCWIQHKKFFFPFFAYFERSSCPNYCTNRFVIKNCISDWKMKKIKRYLFWVFFFKNQKHYVKSCWKCWKCWIQHSKC